MDLSLFLPPLVACLVIVAIHSYLGLHVIAREVIFVDLSLAQMAALGSAVAVLAGRQPDSTAAFLYALGFTSLGAVLFALTRTEERGRVPQEAFIGIVYVVASAAAILVADRTPRGGEAIKDILVGSLLWVTWPTIARLAAIYAAIGVFHWFLRRRFLTISFQPETALANGWSIRWWDFLFYLSFGIVITFSVPIAGVLLVFSFLVVPAAIAFQYSRRQGVLAVISWVAGAVASAAGLFVSFRYDLPTGPVVVCMFGLVLLVAFAVRRLRGTTVAVAERELPEQFIT
ncbi:MAG TPA: iron chelate uptake ABC transporter family permease subunit [Gemmatimonadales bacterium]|nr:iron chelate uptake ABC transporter family permease subunit [Gemmatimonadales bacterium]